MPMPRAARLLRTSLLLALLAVRPGSAADLIEPWDPGFSDLELFVGHGRGGESIGGTVLGFGLGHGLSLGLTLSGGDVPGEAGLILAWSHELGRLGALDLLGFAQTETREAELDRLGRAVGFEWSAPAGGVQPYLRATLLWEEGERFVHPLLGLRVPAGRVDLHLELSSRQPAPDEPWPVHLGVGPNFRLPGGSELLPELSLIWNRAEDRLEPALTVVWITNPASSLRRPPVADPVR